MGRGVWHSRCRCRVRLLPRLNARIPLLPRPGLRRPCRRRRVRLLNCRLKFLIRRVTNLRDRNTSSQWFIGQCLYGRRSVQRKPRSIRSPILNPRVIKLFRQMVSLMKLKKIRLSQSGNTLVPKFMFASSRGRNRRLLRLTFMLSPLVSVSLRKILFFRLT